MPHTSAIAPAKELYRTYCLKPLEPRSHRLRKARRLCQPKSDSAGRDALGLILVRAMIAAARADGRLDAQESQAIFQRIESLGLDPSDQALLAAEMGRPVDVDAIVNSAASPEVAARDLSCFTAGHRCGYRRREVLSCHAGRTSAAATRVGSRIEPPGGDANDS